MPFFGDRRIMACQLVDLERWLRESTGKPSLQFDTADKASGIVSLDAGGWLLQIRASRRVPSTIALIRLPQLEVEFVYPPDRAQAARLWIEAFDRHTQRGGG
jgi:hypothetical protein